MTTRYDIAALKARLGSIRSEDNPALVKQKSRDFFWYSPVLKRQLDHVTADLVVSPTSEAQVLEVLGACHALGIPVTVLRGLEPEASICRHPGGPSPRWAWRWSQCLGTRV